jgi:hypothetical protein
MSAFNPFIEFMKSILPSRMSGKTVMWWITANVIAMCWYVTLHYKDGARLDGAVSIIYGVAVGAFAGKKIADTVTDRRVKPRPTPAPDTDDGGY